MSSTWLDTVEVRQVHLPRRDADRPLRRQAYIRDDYQSGHHQWRIPTWEWHFLGQPVRLTVAVAL
jgi:hypothetical protein